MTDAMPWDNDPIVGQQPAPASPPSGGGKMPWDNDPIVGQSAPQQQASNSGSWGDTALGVGKQLALGAPRWLGQQAGDLADAITGRRTLAAVGSPADSTPETFTKGLPTPYAESLRGAMGVDTGSNAPQGRAERIAAGAGEALPWGIAGGAGGLLRSAATQGAAGAGSAAAQEAVSDKYKPAAGLAGAMLSGHMANRALRPGAPPSIGIEDLYDRANSLKAAARGLGIEWSPQLPATIADTIESNLRTAGYRPIPSTSGAPAFAIADELRNPGTKTVNLDDIDKVRQAFIQLGKNPDHRAAARSAIGDIEDALNDPALMQAHVVNNGHFLNRLQPMMQESRSLTSAAMRGQRLEEGYDSALDKAQRRAGRSGKGDNIANTMKQEVDKILSDPKERRWWTPDEQATMRKIVTSEGAGARRLGGLFPSGPVSWATAMYLADHLHHVIGPAAYPLVAGVGYLGKRASESKIENAIHKLGTDTKHRAIGVGPAPSQPPGYSAFNAPLVSQQNPGEKQGGRVGSSPFDSPFFNKAIRGHPYG